MKNEEVAHLWANKSRRSASGSHYWFQGDCLYSYSTLIARHHKGAVLITTHDYSSSTSCQKNMAWAAASHLKKFRVLNPGAKPGRKDLADYQSRLDYAADRVTRARDVASAVNRHALLRAEANAFARYFGFKRRFKKLSGLARLKKVAKEQERIRREREIDAQVKLEREASVLVAKWLAGEPVRIPYGIVGTYLRVKLKNECSIATVETSRGALVPLADVRFAVGFTLMRRAKGWRRNGEACKVGDYQLDSVSPEGVQAGCSFFAWPEIERFAKSQGWLPRE